VIPIDKPGVFNFTREEPLGVIAAITPWNSPLLLATWKLAPALAAGNTVVWKPSEFSSVSALEFAPLFEKAGFPRGVVNIVTGFGNEVGEPLVTHPDVAKVAFTGGDRTGEAVYQMAATESSPASSPPPAKPALRARARSSIGPFIPSSWIACWPWPKLRAWGIRSI
jgi:aldehyde dehydrogenase (NAD+)